MNEKYVLVPCEPTIVMQQAALEASRRLAALGMSAALPDSRELWAADEVYRAMIAARPPAPVDAQPVATRDRLVPWDAVKVRVALKGLVEDIDDLVGESHGVYGLHLNGDPSPWDELLPGGRFERLTRLDEAREALAAQSPAPATCPACNGNDADMPCAYPGDQKTGCIRDVRLTPAPAAVGDERTIPVANRKSQLKRFEAWYSDYHAKALEDIIKLENADPREVAEDAWMAALSRRILSRPAPADASTAGERDQAQVSERLDLVESVLLGYPQGMARNDALSAVRYLQARAALSQPAATVAQFDSLLLEQDPQKRESGGAS